jgi:hypothetical protein
MNRTPLSIVSNLSLMLTMLVGATGCLANALPTIWPDCHNEMDYAIQRASKEFSCPPEKIGVIWRTDLTDNLYDLAVCDQRARYTCFSDNRKGRSAVYCIREPDPSSWQPDPLTIARLPRPPRAITPARCKPGEERRICRDQQDLDKNHDCIMPIPPATLPQSKETPKTVPVATP